MTGKWRASFSPAFPQLYSLPVATSPYKWPFQLIKSFSYSLISGIHQTSPRPSQKHRRYIFRGILHLPPLPSQPPFCMPSQLLPLMLGSWLADIIQYWQAKIQHLPAMSTFNVTIDILSCLRLNYYYWWGNYNVYCPYGAVTLFLPRNPEIHRMLGHTDQVKQLHLTSWRLTRLWICLVTSTENNSANISRLLQSNMSPCSVRNPSSWTAIVWNGSWTKIPLIWRVKLPMPAVDDLRHGLLFLSFTYRLGQFLHLQYPLLNSSVNIFLP